MWSCSFWTQPQKVVGYHRETHHFSEEKSTKEFTAPQHIRSILPPFHPTKSIAALRGRYFSFSQIKSYVVVQSSKFVFGCLLYNFKVLFLCLKEAGRRVRTAPGFLHTAPWILHKPSERDTAPWPHTFCERAGQRRCTNKGWNFVRIKRWLHYMSRTTSTCFLRLNNSETITRKRSWARQ